MWQLFLLMACLLVPALSSAEQDLSDRRLVFVTSDAERAHSIVVVGTDHKFQSTFFGTESNGSAFPEYRVGMILNVSCLGRVQGQVKVSDIHLTFGSYADVDHAKLSPVDPLSSIPPNCFATNYPLKHTLAVSVVNSIDDRVRTDVNIHLRNRLGKTHLKPKVVDQIISSCGYKQLSWSPSHPPVVMATCNFASRIRGEDGYYLIAIIEVPSKGKARLKYFDGYFASPYAHGDRDEDFYDKGGFIFLDVADLNGDGLPEIAVWESAAEELQLISLEKSNWRKVAASMPGYVTE